MNVISMQVKTFSIFNRILERLNESNQFQNFLSIKNRFRIISLQSRYNLFGFLTRYRSRIKLYFYNFIIYIFIFNLCEL